MSELFNTGETQAQEALDAAALTPENTENGEALDTIADEVPEEPSKDGQAKEPGWIKQRVDKAVEKARKAWEAEQDKKLRPLYENLWDRQAEELVRQGEFKSLERAKEYVRLKGGVDVTPQKEADQKPDKAEPKRDSNGRFTGNNDKPEQDPVLKAKADMLFKQVQKIKARSGVDVMDAFNKDAQVKQKIISGEWDFYDVEDYLQQNGVQGVTTRHVPTPVRSPNGAKTGGLSIADMSEAQFQRLQDNLHNGKRYDARK